MDVKEREQDGPGRAAGAAVAEVPPTQTSALLPEQEEQLRADIVAALKRAKEFFA